MKETDVILKAIMTELLTSETLEEAQTKVSLLLDSEQLAQVREGVDKIMSAKSKKAN